MKISKQLVKIAVVIAVVLIAVIVVIQYIMKPGLSASFAMGNGRVEAKSVDVVSKLSGRLLDVLVKEGDMVQKDQVVAHLNSKELDAQLRQAQAELEQARQAKTYSVAVVAQKQSELDFAQKTFARSQSLYVNNSIALQQLQQDETSAKTAQASLNAAEADVVKADAAIQAAVAQADTISVNRDENTLVAPVTGRVLYRIAEPGEVLKAGGSVLTVLDLTDVYMNIYLPTNQAGRVAWGTEGRILLDAASHYPIEAKVTFVEPRAQFTPKDVETRTEREKLMFKVKVSINPELLKKHIEQVKSGLPGVAYVRLDSKHEWPDYLKLKQAQ